jgi:hypothetical protein
VSSPLRAGEHPLWSSLIWRNEVVDTFIEMVTAPWFARAAAGTPARVWWLRALGARIGAGGTVGPASLVMRGETVPAGSYWIGNPVSPWTDPPTGPARNDPQGL